MGIKIKPSAIRQTKGYEYLIRFLFGGLLTAATGFITAQYGPVVGGLFLAFPSIFPASVTLVQTHKKKQEEKKGKSPQQSEDEGKDSAGKTAEGAALGAFGLFAFAVAIWKLSPALQPWLVLLIAFLLYLGVSILAWFIFNKLSHQDEGEQEAPSGEQNIGTRQP